MSTCNINMKKLLYLLTLLNNFGCTELKSEKLSKLIKLLSGANGFDLRNKLLQLNAFL